MITPANSTGTSAPQSSSLRPRSAPSPLAAPDVLQADQTDRLKAALDRTPAIRTEVVERASHLAVDPNYPPLAIINQVALMIAQSQDLSEAAD